MIELLSPVGDFECLKAAVQNGADCVYFGANSFSARAFASNFDEENLKQAIIYAKIRGVKTNLTLNTLIKNTEFEDAYKLAKTAYHYGIDAIIVQDLGLAKKLIHDFPDLPIHASTQMSVHNLEGILKLQELGFKRVVLSRELSAKEIDFICKNSNVEIECFVHGALCISYSGQCLLSSMIGGRSGNRGKCAQPCRLPYYLVDEKNTPLDKGYLISPRDLCGLDYLPVLVKSGVTSFKIEGRMKTPEYVATVTRIYRKYLDLASSTMLYNSNDLQKEHNAKQTNMLKKHDAEQNNTQKQYTVNPADKKDLLQVFNRGQFSCGHLSSTPNTKLIYKEKSNNMGLPLGTVENYNKNKGHITLILKEKIQIGDTISLENESGTYTISELMQNSKNIEVGNVGTRVTIGRMKGKISVGDKIFKMSSKTLTTNALHSITAENRKIALNATVTVKQNQPLSINITAANDLELYKNLNITYSSLEFPVEALNKPITKDSIIQKISKTGNTPFEFKNITVDMDENVFVPNLSFLNDLRRTGLEMVENYVISNIERKLPISNKENYTLQNTSTTAISKTNLAGNSLQKEAINSNKFAKINYKISVLLNILNLDYDYSKLENIDNLYIPLKYFANSKYENILKLLSTKFNTYIYMPTIIRDNYNKIFNKKINEILEKFDIKGFVLSNISNFTLIKDLCNNRNLELIANYTFNIFNNLSISELSNLGISKYTVSPELDKDSILSFSGNILQELIVYGKIPLMNMNYCLLGKSNKCPSSCDAKCMKQNNSYYLKDRLNMSFEIIPDNIETVTTLYNSKTLSISPSDFYLDFARIDILHEDVYEINNIIEKVRRNLRFEGKDFTNGNLAKNI